MTALLSKSDCTTPTPAQVLSTAQRSGEASGSAAYCVSTSARSVDWCWSLLPLTRASLLSTGGQLLLLSAGRHAVSAMSTSLGPRRSARQRAPAQSLAAEMEYRRLQDADQALMRRLAREPLEYDSASDSDQFEVEPEDDPSADEEEENKENIPPTSGWQPRTHAPCTAQAAVELPRNRARTELGYLRCFLTDTLVDIVVNSTNAYAQSRQATPPFVTDAAEMWRFIAVRIRMGIVQLPEMRMYWQAEYEDRYVTQLFTRPLPAAATLLAHRTAKSTPLSKRSVRSTVTVSPSFRPTTHRAGH